LSELRFRVLIAGPSGGVLRRPVESGQYTSSEYRALLRRHGAVCSMSRRGNCHDNAPTESLFGSLKTERVRGERFETQAEARAALFDYLAFYNHRRRHSALGYLSPAEYERRYYEQQAPGLAA
jgi:putative transposase